MITYFILVRQDGTRARDVQSSSSLDCDPCQAKQKYECKSLGSMYVVL